MSKNVVIVGQGYIGLPIAMAAAGAGYSVVGLDTDIRRISCLTAGQSFVEDVPLRQLANALASGRYRPTNDPAAAELLSRFGAEEATDCHVAEFPALVEVLEQVRKDSRTSETTTQSSCLPITYLPVRRERLVLDTRHRLEPGQNVRFL